jgi:polar amino acid transport system substrate-binding protein
VLAEESAPPYSYVEDGKPFGIDYEIVVEAARRLGIDVNVEFVPWKRMLVAVQYGGCDAGVSFYYVKDRELFGIYLNPPVHYSVNMVFVREGEGFSFLSVSDLFGKKVGITRGYSVSVDFDKAVAGGDLLIEEGDNILSNIHKVLAGRIDCMVGNRDATLNILKRNGLAGKVVHLENPVSEARSAHIMLSRARRLSGDETFVSRFNETLLNMKEDGTFQRILESYVK